MELVIIPILADIKILINSMETKLRITMYVFTLQKQKKKAKTICLFFKYTNRTFFIISKILKFNPLIYMDIKFQYTFVFFLWKIKSLKIYLPNKVKRYWRVTLKSSLRDWNEGLSTTTQNAQSFWSRGRPTINASCLAAPDFWGNAIHQSPSLENPVESSVLLEPRIFSCD